MSSSVIIVIVVLLFSVVFHEVAHGWIAYKLGDPTAKALGRLTLNPIPHIDPMMTIVVPIICYVTMGFAFGGAKPVPVNPYNFKNMKKDMAITAAAGPLSNLLLLTTAIIIYKTLLFFGICDNLIDRMIVNSIFTNTATEVNFLYKTFILFIAFSVIINAVLMVFNLFPIPPLDGSKILMGFLNHRQAAKFEELSRYGFIIIIGIILFGSVFNISIFGAVIGPVIEGFLNFTFF